MKHTRTALVAFALALSSTVGGAADAQPSRLPPRAVVVPVPAGYFDVQYDASTLKATFTAGTQMSWQEIYMSGNARSFGSDGTTPLGNTTFTMDVTGGADSNALGVCFETLNQARLAGGAHVFRIQIVLKQNQLINSGNVTVVGSNLNRVMCQVDP